jgi:FkbM family methyltransferase
MSVHDLKLSSLALKAASVSPRLTATAMKMVAPHLPPYWVINEIATRNDLHIRAKAKLSNGMPIWVLLADEVGVGIRRRGYTEHETLEAITSHLGKDGVFFDLGAHIGQYTLVASPLSRAVHSFEPLPKTFELLASNIQANNLVNVTANQCAVSDASGEVRIYEGDPSTMDRSSLKSPSQTSGRSFVVPSISLDDYVARHGIFPSLIKIDVEGAEIPALRGAANLLREKHPTLIVEVDIVNQTRFGHTTDNLLSEIRGFGYSLSPLENDARLDRSYFNVLAVA